MDNETRSQVGFLREAGAVDDTNVEAFAALHVYERRQVTRQTAVAQIREGAMSGVPLNLDDLGWVEAVQLARRSQVAPSADDSLGALREAGVPLIDGAPSPSAPAAYDRETRTAARVAETESLAALAECGVPTTRPAPQRSSQDLGPLREAIVGKVCPRCEGDGVDLDSATGECQTCAGTGIVLPDDQETPSSVSSGQRRPKVASSRSTATNTPSSAPDRQDSPTTLSDPTGFLAEAGVPMRAA